MEKRSNKENHPKGSGRNMKITSVFKVKKCLFDSQPEYKSPQFKLEAKCRSDKLSLFREQSDSPDIMDNMEESPYSLFSLKKRRAEREMEIERSTPNRKDCSTPLKGSSIFVRKLMEEKAVLKNLSPDNPVKLAVQKSIQNPDLIGDFSQPCVLPIIEGKHPDLKTISPDTVANLLEDIEPKNFIIVDCRYPYEFDGGHIRNARNIYCKSDAEVEFFSNQRNSNKTILIFYCEFSSERAPNMMRFLRRTDRDLNEDRYPHLFYPELYVIEGGYKAFYSTFKELCEPQDYKPMLHKECAEEMSYYRSQCKNWRMQNKRRMRTKAVITSRNHIFSS